MPDDYTKNTTRATAAPRDELHLDHPPRGIKMERAQDGSTVITSRTFSSQGGAYIFFALFWNSLVSVFVCVAIILTSDKFGWNLRPVFMDPPESGSSQVPLWFFWLFLTPFIAIGIYMMYTALFNLFGKCVIRLDADEGSVFAGFGSLGKTQRFAPKSVKSVGDRKTDDEIGDRPNYQLSILMNNGRVIKIPGLGKMRKTWLVFALNKLLNPGKGT